MPVESAKVRYYRNEASRTGRYPITTGLNSHKINSIKRRARLPESYESAATTVPYSSDSPDSLRSQRTQSARTQSANTVIEERIQPRRNTRRRFQRFQRIQRILRGLRRGNTRRRTVEI